MALPQASVNVLVLWAVFGCFLGSIAVGLRFYARYLKGSALAINDYAAAMALVFSLAIGGVLFEATVRGGLGAHDDELEDSMAQAVVLLKCLLPFQILWAAANTCVRVSICHLYVTIFCLRPFRFAAYAVMTLSMLYFVAAVLQTLLFCDPFFANWDSAAPEAVCGDRLAAFVAVGTINLLIDVTVIILPMPMLWALRLPVAKKLGLTAIFGIGVVICIISVIRVVTLAQINTTDFSYRLGQIGYWSVLEPTLGIISCCLPVLPPVLSKLLGPSPTFEMQHPASNDTGRFNRMPDDVEGTYPLTSRSESFQKSEAYGGRPSGNYSEVSLGRERGDVPPVPAPGVVMGMGMGIVVERAFSVATTRTRDEEGVGRAL